MYVVRCSGVGAVVYMGGAHVGAVVYMGGAGSVVYVSGVVV